MSTAAAQWEQWKQWAAKFAVLTRRERIIVAAAVLLGGGFLIFNFGIDPFLLKARTASRAESQARIELAGLQAQLAMFKTQKIDPDAANLRRLAQAKQELAAVGGRLANFEAGMVPSSRMQAVLEGLLARNRAIDLLGLKTLPVTLVGAPAKAASPPAAGATNATATAAATAAAAEAKNPAAEKPAPAEAGEGTSEGIYQHGLEIRLAGSYNDLLNYLTEIERLPQRLMWNSISFKVEKYPRNIMVLRVYTLSFDKNWLMV